MNSNTIMQSDLLDIIFENRNKEYGAYILRRDYNTRLLKSLLAMLGAIYMLAVWIAFKPGNSPQNLGVTLVPDTIVVTNLKEKKVPLPIFKQSAQKKQFLLNNNSNPIVVDDNKVEKKMNIDEPITTLNIKGDIIGMPINDKPESNPPTENSKDIVEAAKTSVDKTTPRSSVDVMPQYPGGIKELIRYLKRNLTSPNALDDGEEINVKIKFVVNYDGSLIGFTILQSGGDAFDNEVLRVLKKMPKWIPGKSDGENVSVYYIIPVKFNTEL